MKKLLFIIFLTYLYFFNFINSTSASVYPDSFIVSDVTFDENTKTLSFNYSSSPSFTISQFTKVQLIAEDGSWFMGNNICTVNHCDISNLYDYDRNIFFSRNLYSPTTNLQVSIYPDYVTQIYSQKFSFNSLFPQTTNNPKSIIVSNASYEPENKIFSFMFEAYPEGTSFNNISLKKLHITIDDGSIFEGNWSCVDNYCKIQNLSEPLHNISLSSALYPHSTRLQVVFLSENNEIFASQSLTMMDIFPPATYFPTSINITNLLFDPDANTLSFDYITKPELLNNTFHKIQVNMEDGYMFLGTWYCQHNHCQIYGLFDSDRNIYFSDTLYPPFTKFQISIYPTEQWQIYSQKFTVSEIFSRTPPITSLETNIPTSQDQSSTKPVIVKLNAIASAGHAISNIYYIINNDLQQTYTKPFTLSSIGKHTITYWAVDDTGLIESKRTQIIQIIYPFNGFLWPVKNLPAINKVKLTLNFIPFPFSIGGYKGKKIVDTITSNQITCPIIPWQELGTDLTLHTNIGGLIYNPFTKHYIYFWDTNKNWKNTCRKLTLKLVDGTEHSADFYFR